MSTTSRSVTPQYLATSTRSGPSYRQAMSTAGHGTALNSGTDQAPISDATPSGSTTPSMSTVVAPGTTSTIVPPHPVLTLAVDLGRQRKDLIQVLDLDEHRGRPGREEPQGRAAGPLGWGRATTPVRMAALSGCS